MEQFWNQEESTSLVDTTLLARASRCFLETSLTNMKTPSTLHIYKKGDEEVQYSMEKTKSAYMGHQQWYMYATRMVQ